MSEIILDEYTSSASPVFQQDQVIEEANSTRLSDDKGLVLGACKKDFQPVCQLPEADEICVRHDTICLTCDSLSDCSDCRSDFCTCDSLCDSFTPCQCDAFCDGYNPCPQNYNRVPEYHISGATLEGTSGHLVTTYVSLVTIGQFLKTRATKNAASGTSYQPVWNFYAGGSGEESAMCVNFGAAYQGVGHVIGSNGISGSTATTLVYQPVTSAQVGTQATLSMVVFSAVASTVETRGLCNSKHNVTITSTTLPIRIYNVQSTYALNYNFSYLTTYALSRTITEKPSSLPIVPLPEVVVAGDYRKTYQTVSIYYYFNNDQNTGSTSVSGYMTESGFTASTTVAPVVPTHAGTVYVQIDWEEYGWGQMPVQSYNCSITVYSVDGGEMLYEGYFDLLEVINYGVTIEVPFYDDHDDRLNIEIMAQDATGGNAWNDPNLGDYDMWIDYNEYISASGDHCTLQDFVDTCIIGVITTVNYADGDECNVYLGTMGN